MTMVGAGAAAAAAAAVPAATSLDGARRAEEQLQAVLFALADPWLVLDAVRKDGYGEIVDFRCAAANEAAVRALGTLAATVVGLTWTELFADAADGLRVQCVEAVEAGLPFPLTEGDLLRVPGFDGRIVPAGDGVALTWSLGAGPSTDPVLATPLLAGSGGGGSDGSDERIHALATAALRLARSEKLFRLAMSSAPVGMALVDLDLRFLSVNASLSRMLGRDEAWLLTHGMLDVLEPEGRWLDLAMRAELLAGRSESVSHTQHLVTATGALVVVEHSLAVLPGDDGEPQSYVSQFVDVTEAQRASEKLRFLASHDALTSLANRRELTERMGSILGHRPRTGTRLGVLFLDLDGLKPINDTLGHSAGDGLLVAAAQRIASALRSDDVVARIGGDEFVVALPSIHSIADAEAVAGKIHQALAEPIAVDGHELCITVSIGAVVADPGDDTDAVLAQADHALYRAKRAGKNRTVAYDPDLDR